jgi:hypothetical protein
MEHAVPQTPTWFEAGQLRTSCVSARRRPLSPASGQGHPRRSPHCGGRQIRGYRGCSRSKKPVECIEYVIAHEMVHLLERLHNDRFKALMDEFIPSSYANRTASLPA